jgi:transposase
MKHYSRAVKLEAVRLYTEEGKSQAEVMEELGSQSVRTLKQWLHDYRQEGEQAFAPKRRKGPVGRRPKRENTAAYIAWLEMENDLLKNSMPNCATKSSPSAISAHLPPIGCERQIIDKCNTGNLKIQIIEWVTLLFQFRHSLPSSTPTLGAVLEKFSLFWLSCQR